MLSAVVNEKYIAKYFYWILTRLKRAMSENHLEIPQTFVRDDCVNEWYFIYTISEKKKFSAKKKKKSVLIRWKYFFSPFKGKTKSFLEVYCREKELHLKRLFLQHLGSWNSLSMENGLLWQAEFLGWQKALFSLLVPLSTLIEIRCHRPEPDAKQRCWPPCMCLSLSTFI